MLQIVEGYSTSIVVKGQKSFSMQAVQLIARSIRAHPSGVTPQGTNRRNRDVGVLGEHRQLEVALAFCRRERLGAEPQRAKDAAIRVNEEFEPPFSNADSTSSQEVPPCT